VKELLYEQPTFDNVYALMNWVQKAKVDMAMMNSTLSQMVKVILDMRNQLPVANCNATKAKEIIKGILDAKAIEDIVNHMAIAKKMGGLDTVIKCLIKDAMKKTIAEFWKFYSKEKIEMVKLTKELKEYEKLPKSLKVG